MKPPFVILNATLLSHFDNPRNGLKGVHIILDRENPDHIKTAKMLEKEIEEHAKALQVNHLPSFKATMDGRLLIVTLHHSKHGFITCDRSKKPTYPRMNQYPRVGDTVNVVVQFEAVHGLILALMTPALQFVNRSTSTDR